MTHQEVYESAGKTVTIDLGKGPLKYEVEDWWDRVAGRSWMYAEGNPAALLYALRSGNRSPSVPMDDEVLYGTINGIGYLVHITEVVDGT